jgi:hypothetical protein
MTVIGITRKSLATMGLCASLCPQLFGAPPALGIEDPVIQGASTRAKTAAFPASTEAPLLNPGTAVVEISDDSGGSFNEERIAELLAEKPESDDSS